MVHDYLKKSIEKQTGRASDCIYCQPGRTACKTVERREWLRWEPLLTDLNRSLDSRPDYITFSGLAELFEPRAEVIDEYAQPPLDDRAGSGADRILDTLCRRPCAIEDVIATHGLHQNEVVKSPDELSRDGLVERVAIESDFYYRAIRRPETGHGGATAGDDAW